MGRWLVRGLLSLVVIAAASAELTVPVAGPYIPAKARAIGTWGDAGEEEQQCGKDEWYDECPSDFDRTCELWETNEETPETELRKGFCGTPGCRCKPGYRRLYEWGSVCIQGRALLCSDKQQASDTCLPTEAGRNCHVCEQTCKRPFIITNCITGKCEDACHCRFGLFRDSVLGDCITPRECFERGKWGGDSMWPPLSTTSGRTSSSTENPTPSSDHPTSPSPPTSELYPVRKCPTKEAKPSDPDIDCSVDCGPDAYWDNCPTQLDCDCSCYEGHPKPRSTVRRSGTLNERSEGEKCHSKPRCMCEWNYVRSVRGDMNSTCMPIDQCMVTTTSQQPPSSAPTSERPSTGSSNPIPTSGPSPRTVPSSTSDRPPTKTTSHWTTSGGEHSCGPNADWAPCPLYKDGSCDDIREDEEGHQKRRKRAGHCLKAGCRCHQGFVRQTKGYDNHCVKFEDCLPPKTTTGMPLTTNTTTTHTTTTSKRPPTATTSSPSSTSSSESPSPPPPQPTTEPPTSPTSCPGQCGCNARYVNCPQTKDASCDDAPDSEELFARNGREKRACLKPACRCDPGYVRQTAGYDDACVKIESCKPPPPTTTTTSRNTTSHSTKNTTSTASRTTSKTTFEPPAAETTSSSSTSAIPIIHTTTPKSPLCGPNEDYAVCPRRKDLTCDTRLHPGDVSPPSTACMTPGCRCTPGHVRLTTEPTAGCVPICECPNYDPFAELECGQNEEFVKCPQFEDATCNEVPEPRRASAFGEDCLKPRCMCKAGYVRENRERDASCVSKHVCLRKRHPDDSDEYAKLKDGRGGGDGRD